MAAEAPLAPGAAVRHPQYRRGILGVSTNASSKLSLLASSASSPQRALRRHSSSTSEYPEKLSIATLRNRQASYLAGRIIGDAGNQAAKSAGSLTKRRVIDARKALTNLFNRNPDTCRGFRILIGYDIKSPSTIL